MAKAALTIGGELDIVTPGELRDVRDDIKDSIFANRPVREVKPFYRPLVNSVVSSGGTTLVSVGSPPDGRLWAVNQLILCGTDDHTAIAGLTTAALYVGDPTYAVDIAPLGCLIQVGITTTPYQANYSKNTQWVHPAEELFAVCYGVTANQQVTLVARVTDYAEDVIEGKRV